MSKTSNGESEVEFGELDQDQKLEVIFDSILDLVETVEELKINLAELGEKVGNLEVPSVGFNLDPFEFDS